MQGQQLSRGLDQARAGSQLPTSEATTATGLDTKQKDPRAAQQPPRPAPPAGPLPDPPSETVPGQAEAAVHLTAKDEKRWPGTSLRRGQGTPENRATLTHHRAWAPGGGLSSSPRTSLTQERPRTRFSPSPGPGARSFQTNPGRQKWAFLMAATLTALPREKRASPREGTGPAFHPRPRRTKATGALALRPHQTWTRSAAPQDLTGPQDAGLGTKGWGQLWVGLPPCSFHGREASCRDVASSVPNPPHQPHSPQPDHGTQGRSEPETGRATPACVSLKRAPTGIRTRGPRGRNIQVNRGCGRSSPATERPRALPGVAVLVLGVLSGAVDSVSAPRLS